MDTLRVVARSVLIDVLSARENATNSGLVARAAGQAIGADTFLPNMGTEEFLSCLSRGALEGSCKNTAVLPRARVRDTRAALVEFFTAKRFVHPSARFAPDRATFSDWLEKNRQAEVNGEDVGAEAEGLPEDAAGIDRDEAADGVDVAGVDTGRDDNPESGSEDGIEPYREAAE